MVLKRLFNRQKTGSWIAGIFVDPPEVAHAWFDMKDPDSTLHTGIATDVPTALERLSQWQTESGMHVRAIGVNERLPGRITGAGTTDLCPTSPLKMVEEQAQAHGIDAQLITVASMPWLLQALSIPTAPRAGAIIDRSNLAVALKEDGTSWVAGEWSDAYARTGSIGAVILRAANLLAEIIDARQPVSGLRTALPTAIAQEDPQAFFDWVDRKAHNDVDGCLAVLDAVYALARSGDLIAERLVNVIAADIGRTIVAAIEQTSLQAARMQVHLAGRVLERIPTLRAGIAHRIELVNPSVHLETVTLMHLGEALARAVLASGVLTQR